MKGNLNMINWSNEAEACEQIKELVAKYYTTLQDSSSIR